MFYAIHWDLFSRRERRSEKLVLILIIIVIRQCNLAVAHFKGYGFYSISKNVVDLNGNNKSTP